MALTINIKGKGKVDKVVEDDSATLTATAEESWLFKYFLIGDIQYSANPYTFECDGSDLVIDSTFYIPIESYLRGLVAFEVPDSAITANLLYRKVEFNADPDDLTEKQKDLLLADVLRWGSTSPSSYTGKKESDGGWSSTGESKTVSSADKKRFAEMANDIYIKYGDSRKSSANIKAFSWNGFYR